MEYTEEQIDQWYMDNLSVAENSALGIYLPQAFATDYPRGKCAKADWDILLQGPEHPEYWEAWGAIAESWEHEADGSIIHIIDGEAFVGPRIPEGMDIH